MILQLKKEKEHSKMSVTNELENTEVGISFMLNLVPFFSKSSDPLPIRDLPLFTLE